MLGQITIFRATGKNRNAEVLDVLERLGREECGSAVNAAVVCIRESPRFRAMLTKIRAERESEPGEGAQAASVVATATSD